MKDSDRHAAWRPDVARRVARAVVLALNPVYLPHRQLKWQRQLLSGLEVAPDLFSERRGLLPQAPPAGAVAAAEALLADVVFLVRAHTDADISGYLDVLAQRHPAIDPPGSGGTEVSLAAR